MTSVAFSPYGQYALTGSGNSAILWHVESGKELRVFEGHSSLVTSVTFSPDGLQALTGSQDGTARLWGVETGEELQRFESSLTYLNSAAFSPDGRYVLAGGFGWSLTRGSDLAARLWSVNTGKEVRLFKGHTGDVHSVAFSRDGRFGLTGSKDGTACLWSIKSGQEIRRFRGHTSYVYSVALSPDGQYALTGSLDRTARLWKVETGQELSLLKHTGAVTSVAFAPNGLHALTGGIYDRVRLWEVATGRELGRLEEDISSVLSVAFSPDGRYALAGGHNKTAHLWDVDTGRDLRRFEGHAEGMTSVAISPDGRYALASSWGGLFLWEVSLGREPRCLQRQGGAMAAFSADSRYALTCQGSTAVLWDVESGIERRRFDGHSDTVTSVAISGKYALTGSMDGTARLWDVETGRQLRCLRTDKATGAVTSVALSPDCRYALTASMVGFVWDVETGEELRLLLGDVDSVAISPDGRFALTRSSSGITILWDLETGQQIRELRQLACSIAFASDRPYALAMDEASPHLYEVDTGQKFRRLEAFPRAEGVRNAVGSVVFSPDGRYVLGSSIDCIHLWDASSGERLAALYSFKDETWAVIDREGRYDASNGGAVQGLHWVVGLEFFELEQLKDRYYEPQLLAKITGFNKEPLRDVTTFEDPQLPPAFDLRPPSGDGPPTLGVSIRNRGGGIGPVIVWLNGKEVTPDAAPRSDPEAGSLDLEVSLSNHPALRLGRENWVEVRVFNGEGYVASQTRTLRFVSSEEMVAVLPRLWAVVAGVSDYAGNELDLRYAAKDALNFGEVIRLAAERLFGPERVNVRVLSTDKEGGALAPTREALVSAMEEIADQASSEDILVVYLSGHGVTHGGPEGDYYFLTREARSGNLGDPAIRDAVALSSDQLAELMNGIPALKQVLILDTCGAGQFVERLSENREISSSQVRAIQRMRDRTGMFVLAGSAADAVSYEASRFAQGLLTYSILTGMRGAALRDGEFADVLTLFNHAVEQVPKLAIDIGGIQRPEIAIPRSGSFDIGQLTDDEKARVPVALPRPCVLRANFQDYQRFVDHLGLGRLVNAALRDAAGRSQNAPLVFVDADDFFDAYLISGRYLIDNGAVAVTAHVFRGEEEVSVFEVTGLSSDVESLARQIVQQTEDRLR